MARIKALPGLEVIRGFKGVIDFYLWKGLPCARKWPHTPRSHLTAATLASAQLFGEIALAYNQLANEVLAAFQEDAADQPRTARDIFMSATLGHLHERTEVPPPPPPEVVLMFGSWLNPETETFSTSAFAWKGVFVKPMLDIAVHALGAKGDWPQAITLKYGLFTVAAGLIASVVYKSTGVTLPPVLDVNPSEARIWETFDPPWQLAGGVLYLLMVGRSDGADTYALPVSYPGTFESAPFPAHEQAVSSGRVAKADPLVGDPVDTTTGALHLSATWAYA